MTTLGELAGRGFLGIEVKYHENLSGEAATHKPRYDEIATTMGCFRPESSHCLKEQPLQQIWRDHLLAGVLRHVGRYDDGYFLLLHPVANPHCTRAVDAYRKCLTCSDTFASLTLETLVDEIAKHAEAEWVRKVNDRYLDFGKVDALLASDQPSAVA